MKLLIVIFCFLTTFTVCLKANDDITFIGNKALGMNTLPLNDLKSIFLNDKTALSNGKDVQPVLSDDKKVHQIFLKEIVRKTPSSYRIFWKKLVFSGEAEMPVSLANDAAVIEFVKNNKNAIGYISTSAYKGDDQIVKFNIGSGK